MVLMPVREYHAADSVRVGSEIAYVGQDYVDAVHIFIREAHAAVNDDYIAAALERRHILADLAEAAQRDYFQFRYHIYSILNKFLRENLWQSENCPLCMRIKYNRTRVFEYRERIFYTLISHFSAPFHGAVERGVVGKLKV